MNSSVQNVNSRPLSSYSRDTSLATKCVFLASKIRLDRVIEGIDDDETIMRRQDAMFKIRRDIRKNFIESPEILIKGYVL